MKTIYDWWKDFDRNVVPKDAPEIQHREMQRAFYVGFFSCLSAANQIAEKMADDRNAGADEFQRLYDECLAFALDQGNRGKL